MDLWDSLYAETRSHPLVQAISTLTSRSATNDQNLQITFWHIPWDTVDSFFNLAYGFAAGTAVIEGPALQHCSDEMDRLFTAIFEVHEDYQTEFRKYEGDSFSEFDLWPYLLINDKIAAIIYSLHGLSAGCYYGGFEIYGGLGKYISWYETPYEIFENFLNNFGYIYTGIRDIIFFGMQDARTPIKNEYGLAVTIGQIYYWLLISRHFSQLTYTVSPIPIDLVTGQKKQYPPIMIKEPPKISGVMIVS